jgi:F-type H+-transporting ATPase subunit c
MAQTGLVALSAALAVCVSAIGSAMGQGWASAKAFESIARQPETMGTIRTLLFIALAFIETLTIYGLLIAFMIVGKM